MSCSEFKYWQAFNLLEPVGIYREDILSANIVKTMADLKAPEHDLGFSDFMMFKPRVERTVDDVCDDIKTRMAGFI